MDREAELREFVAARGAALDSCHLADLGPPALQVWFSDPSDKYFVLSPDLRARVSEVDMDGERQVFMALHEVDATDKDLRVLESMIDSTSID